jgi:hypothetical protein
MFSKAVANFFMLAVLAFSLISKTSSYFVASRRSAKLYATKLSSGIEADESESLTSEKVSIPVNVQQKISEVVEAAFVEQSRPRVSKDMLISSIREKGRALLGEVRRPASKEEAWR